MIERIVDNIYKIDVHLPKSPLKVLNSYYIKGEDRSLLIDTGFNRTECFDALREGLSELGADMKKTDIYLTHLHSDHTGLVPHIATENTKIFISREDNAILRKNQDGTRSMFNDEVYIKEGFEKDEMDAMAEVNPAKKYAPPFMPGAIEVQDGDVLNYGGYELEVIMVPGHTPGNTCLYIKEKKLMFLGDHVLFDITPNIIAWNELDNALGNYCESLLKIRNYTVEIPLPGHRAASVDFYDRIDQILYHHQQRLAEAYSIIEREPGLNAYQIAGKMTWKIKCNSWEDFPLTQKWFAVGEARSHMEYLIAEGKVRRAEENGKYKYYVNQR